MMIKNTENKQSKLINHKQTQTQTQKTKTKWQNSLNLEFLMA